MEQFDWSIKALHDTLLSKSECLKLQNLVNVADNKLNINSRTDAIIRVYKNIVFCGKWFFKVPTNLTYYLSHLSLLLICIIF